MLSLHVRGRGALFRPKRLRKFSDLNFCAAKKHRSHPMLMPSLSSLPWMGVHPTGIEKRKTLGMHPRRMGSFTIPLKVGARLHCQGAHVPETST